MAYHVVYHVAVFQTFASVVKIQNIVTIQMKATQTYFPDFVSTFSASG